MSSFFARAKTLAAAAKVRVVDSTKKGYAGGEQQGSRAADAVEERTAKKDTPTNPAESPHAPVDTTSTDPPQWKSVVKKTGGVFGALAGATVGVGRALYGVPKDILRERAKEKQTEGFEHGWGIRELARIEAPTGLIQEKRPVRVVCVRHGHGFHNDVGGLSNVGNRDALLSPLGLEQCQLLQEKLARFHFDMVVVSPMRRTLQTSIHVLGAVTSTSVRTLVQPLCAEHNGGTFTNDHINQLRSVVARGDLGSPPTTLRDSFPSEEYPQFNGFSQLSDTWWEHGQEEGYETKDSFAKRAQELRVWLGSLGPELSGGGGGSGIPTVLLVSHGGILSETFQFSSDVTLRKEGGQGGSARSHGKMQNCEVRVYDVGVDGSFVRPVAVEEGGGGGRGGGGGGQGWDGE